MVGPHPPYSHTSKDGESELGPPASVARLAQKKGRDEPSGQKHMRAIEHFFGHIPVDIHERYHTVLAPRLFFHMFIFLSFPFRCHLLNVFGCTEVRYGGTCVDVQYCKLAYIPHEKMCEVDIARRGVLNLDFPSMCVGE